MLERISTHRGPSVLRTGASAIAAGLLLFASVFAEVLVSVERDGRITNLPLASLYIAGFVAGAAALIVAFYSLGAHCEERRALRVGAGVLATIAAVDLTRGGVFEAHGARPAAWLVFAVAWLVGRDFRRRRGELSLLRDRATRTASA